MNYCGVLFQEPIATCKEETMPRQARLDVPGTLHHVIIRKIEKRQIVDDQQDRSRFVSRMGELAFETGTVIYAWALLYFKKGGAIP
jgi:hypothetical protein